MFSCRCIPRTLNAYKNSASSHSRRAFRITHVRAGSVKSTAVLCREHSVPLPSSYRGLLPHQHETVRSLSSSSSLFDIQIVHTPPFAESITEGDIRWDKEVGDKVELDEVIGEIETDKTALPINSPCAGVLEELLVEDGATVHKGDELAKINTSGAGGAAPTPAAAEPAAPTSPSPPSPQVASPAAPEPGAPEKLISRTPATPPPPRQPTTPISKPATPAATQTSYSSEVKIVKEAPTRVIGSREEVKVKMPKMRQRIAQRLKDAQNTNAMLTTFNEIDMSSAMSMRSEYKDLFLKTHDLKLGFMSYFLKASATALAEMPAVNAVIEDDYVVYRDFVDISVAMGTPKGLIVPILRDVHAMGFADIERGMANLAEKARTGTIAVEDMDGGTFTISNGGVFGSLMGTPIINPPQSAILGMHGIFDRPVAVKGKVEIRPMMYIALTYDHRLIDGREGVTFLRKIKQNVEDPKRMLLNV